MSKGHTNRCCLYTGQVVFILHTAGSWLVSTTRERSLQRRVWAPGWKGTQHLTGKCRATSLVARFVGLDSELCILDRLEHFWAIGKLSGCFLHQTPTFPASKQPTSYPLMKNSLFPSFQQAFSASNKPSQLPTSLFSLPPASFSLTAGHQAVS